MALGGGKKCSSTKTYLSSAGSRIPPRREETEEENAGRSRSEADLRGSLSNNSLSEDERRQIEEDRARAEEAADLRDEDYQLAYAIDILKGLSALGPEYAAALARQQN